MAIIVKLNDSIYFYKDENCPKQYKDFGIFVDDNFTPPTDGKYFLDIQLGQAVWVLEKTLRELKEDKIKGSKLELENYLQNNPIKWTNNKFYSITLEKQQLLQIQLNLYIQAKTNNLEYKLMWNASGEETEEWQYEDLLNLSIEINKIVQPLVQYQQRKEIEIKNCETVDELEQINIDYNNIEEQEIISE